MCLFDVSYDQQKVMINSQANHRSDFWVGTMITLCFTKKQLCSCFQVITMSLSSREPISHIFRIPPHLIQYICQLLIDSRTNDKLCIRELFTDVRSFFLSCKHFYRLVLDSCITFGITIGIIGSSWIQMKDFLHFICGINTYTCWQVSKLDLNVEFRDDEAVFEWDVLNDFFEHNSELFKKQFELVSLSLYQSPGGTSQSIEVAVNSFFGIVVHLNSFNSELKYRVLSNLTEEKIWKSFPGRNRIKYFSPSSRNFSSVSVFREMFENLTHLSFTQPKIVNIEIIRPLVKLKVLNVQCLNIEQTSPSVLSSFPDLKRLNLFGQCRITLTKLITSMGSLFPSLEILRLILRAAVDSEEGRGRTVTFQRDGIEIRATEVNRESLGGAAEESLSDTTSAIRSTGGREDLLESMRQSRPRQAVASSSPEIMSTQDEQMRTLKTIKCIAVSSKYELFQYFVRCEDIKFLRVEIPTAVKLFSGNEMKSWQCSLKILNLHYSMLPENLMQEILNVLKYQPELEVISILGKENSVLEISETGLFVFKMPKLKLKDELAQSNWTAEALDVIKAHNLKLLVINGKVQMIKLELSQMTIQQIDYLDEICSWDIRQNCVFTPDCSALLG